MWLTVMKIRKNTLGTHGDSCGTKQSHKKLHNNKNLTPEIVEAAMQKHAELIAQEMQREKQQGLGRPINSFESNGKKFVEVGGRIFSVGNSKTFHDFLFDYIVSVLGGKWVTLEIEKEYKKRNPIIQWYQHLCDFQRDHLMVKGEVVSAEMTGAVSGYLNLAYNLYLLAHNVEIQEMLIKRLKNNDNFAGAYYETFVAAAFIKAGFNLEFENEQDGQTTHCEFIATYTKTGAKFSVEAKARDMNKKNADVKNQIYNALKKDAKYTRVIFIELNIEDGDYTIHPATFYKEAISYIREYESKKKELPPAYIIVTNFPFRYALESTQFRWSAIGEGFKIPDFKADYLYPNIRRALENEKKHYEIYMLMDSMKDCHNIPSTFNGEISEFIFGKKNKERLMIGHKYLIPLKSGEEAVGVLKDACVVESEKMIYGTYNTENGESIICRAPMCEEEMRAYKQYPETFFGVFKNIVHNATSPLDLYKWLYETYKMTSKENLLEFMKKSDSDQIIYRDRNHEDILKIYCEGLASQMWRERQEKQH